MKKLRVSLIQNNATEDWEKNLSKIDQLLARAVQKKSKIIALPETFYYRGSSQHYQTLAKHLTPFVLDRYQKLAKKKRVSILLGSVFEYIKNSKKFYNTSYLISESGRLAAKYRKIHLFDNALKGASVQESKHLEHGKRIITAKMAGTKVGLSVCYDLRFPELYRKLSKAGAKILFVPANFTKVTGEVHWEVLLRARAIENQAFVLAPGQIGKHPSTKIMSFGESMVVDPWGTVLARGSQRKEEIITVDIDLDLPRRLKRVFPVLNHRRL